MKPSQTRIFVFAFSALAHGLLFFWLWQLPIPSKPRFTSHPPLLLVWQDEKPLNGPLSSRSGDATKTSTSHRTQQHGLKLGLQHPWGSLPVAPAGPDASSGFKKDIQSAWGSGGGDFARIKDGLLFSKIHEKIDNALFYPGVFIHHRVEGTSNSRLVLLPDGICDWRQTQIHSTEKHLHLFTLFLLKKVCSGGHFAQLGIKEPMVADLSFLFQIDANAIRDIEKRPQFIVGNVLNFERHGTAFPTQWELGPFTGVFPIPMVTLNMQWLQENWEQYVEGRNPMRSYESPDS